MFIDSPATETVSTATSSNPILSLLIPAYNEERYLGPVLARVHRCFAAIGFTDYEIVVCNNNSSDRTAEVAEAGGARVVFEGHNMISKARNAAARAARGQWLIFLDADTLPSPELFAATIERLRGGRVFGGGAGLRFDTPNTGILTSVMFSVWGMVSATLKLASGSYVYCYKQAFDDVGGFDEDLYATEEISFSRKLKQWGRERGLRFEILTKTPVVSSSRKMEWYGQYQVFWRSIKVMLPGVTRSRADCSLWYVRPTAGAQPKLAMSLANKAPVASFG